MAGTTAIFSSSLLLFSSSSSSPTKFHISDFSPANSLLPHSTSSYHHRHPSRNYRTTQRRSTNPRISISHAKLNNRHSREGEAASKELEEAFFFNGDDEIEDEIQEEEEDEEEEEIESSMDLLFRFLQSMFNKVSKRAKKATRSMLPPAISPQLVSFAVDGVLLLTLLSIVKALLQVVCTLGGTVFVVILLMRVIWTTVSHFQSTGNNFNQNGSTYGYGTTQPSM